MSVIKTQRLILTPVTSQDFEPLCALWQNPDFVRDITGRPLTPEEVWMRLLRDIGHWQVLGYGNWAIRLAQGNIWIGSVGIFDYRRDTLPAFEAPELGWGLDPAFQGLGYATEALEAALRFADSQLEARRTLCMISHGNEASLKLARIVGFKYLQEVNYHTEIISLFERVKPW